MSSPERSVQQRDPLAALMSRPTAYLAVIAVSGYAAFMTWQNRDQIENTLLAVVAVLIVLAAGVVLCIATSPLRAPVSPRTLTAVVGLSLAALLLSSLSMWSTDAFIRDDWGTAATGMYIIALAPYRPAKELATAGVLAAIFAGVLAIVQADSFVTPVSPIAFVVVAVTPLLAMSLAAAAFTDVLVRSLDRWRVRARRAFTAMTDESGESIARSVQQDSVTVLNQEVVPFFTALLDGATVTERTRDRAREISDSVRAVMVADVDRTWLETVITQASRRYHKGSAPVEGAVRDEHRLAEHMSTDERTAVRALVVALHAHESFDPQAASIEIADRDGMCEVVMRLRVESTDGALRGDLAPFIAVIRVMFSDLQLEHDHPHLTLRFSYEQR